jgi:uncharacterized protein (TIGR02646 family)
MLYIQKNAEPPELTTHRLQGRDYEAMTNKADANGQEIVPVRKVVLDALLKEQGHLCAYCMQRITAENMQIEHRLSQKRMPEKAVVYSNFLGVCSGKTEAILHCDKQKSAVHDSISPENWQPLYTNPNDKTQMNTIHYITGSGKIYATNVQIEDEINRVLNLNNNDIIKRNRYNTVIEIIQKLGRNWTKSDIQKALKDWQSSNKKGQLRPYCGIAIAFLNKKLKTLVQK